MAPVEVSELPASDREVRGLPSLWSAAPARPVSVPRPRRRWWLRVMVPAAALGAFGGLLAYAARSALWPSVAVRVVPVVVRAASQAEGQAPVSAPEGGVIQAPGWFEPSPYPIGVPALIDGIVVEVLALEGDRVEAGQVIARLDAAEEMLREQSAAAIVGEREADVAVARAALAEATARAAVEAAAAEELRYELERKRELAVSGGVSAGDVRRLEIRLRGQEAAVAAAGAAVKQGEATVGRAEASVAVARAALAEATLRRERTAVRAPAGGVVLNRMVEPGMRITMGGRSGEARAGESGLVARLYDPGRLQVRVDVPLADAGRVAIGSAAEITTEGAPGRVFRGSVVREVHEANIQRNTVQFKVSLLESSPILKPEMLARVRLTAGHSNENLGTGAGTGAAGVMVLPAAAIEERAGSEAWVWVVSIAGSDQAARTVARKQTIQIGAEDAEGYVEVRGGVRPGERVIAGGAAGLRPGVRVRVLGEAGTEGDEGAAR